MGKLLSPRLVVRPMSMADLEDFREIVFDPRVHSTLIVAPSVYLKVLEECADGPERGEAAHQFSATATLVSECQFVAGGLLYQNNLSYFVHPEMWRRGIGLEFVAMFLGEIARLPGLTEVTACVLRNNVASRLILERVGFRFTGLAYHKRENEMTRLAVLNYRYSLG